MPDYDLSGLAPRSFEQLVQAISAKVVGPGIIVFGDGPDGGREATFEGKMDFPSRNEAWNGYLVVQAKFRTKPTFDERDARWLEGQLDDELKKFEKRKGGLRRPEYYIIATNVELSAVPEQKVEIGKRKTKRVGGKARIDAVFLKHKDHLKIRSHRVWDATQLRTYLDSATEIQRTYAAWITPGDVLKSVLEWIGLQKIDFDKTMSNFLMRELRADQYVNLRQAGYTSDEQTPLANIFVDLPFVPFESREPNEREYGIRGEEEEEEEYDNEEQRKPHRGPRRKKEGIVAKLITAGAEKLDPETQHLCVRRPGEGDLELRSGRFVLVGGPGQGKSTLGQFVAQLYRTSLLRDRPKSSLSHDTKSVLKNILEQCEAEGIFLPNGRRFPIRIELPQFADRLVPDEQASLSDRKAKLTVLSFIVDRINRIAEDQITISDFRKWFSSYPWLLIFDGLDEVPSTGNRAAVISAISDFWDEVASRNADVFVIVTTRPQGYNEELSPRFYQHLLLRKFTPSEALHYAHRLVPARFPDLDQRDRILTRIERAAGDPGTARMLVSPLQVTIMAALIDGKGDLPQDRWRLFAGYYAVIRDREQSKHGKVAAILKSQSMNIDAIHHYSGLVLQIESEREGGSESYFSRERLRQLINIRLAMRGIEGEDSEKITEQISQVATQRLVFLVGQVEGTVSFEIRSLQEFMAGAALMTGADIYVQKRLRHIAGISHWRNVFLFCASKCFSDVGAEHHCDTVLNVCDELNGLNRDPVAKLIKAGARLALDLLDDGIAQGQQPYQNHLWKASLEALDLPPGPIQDRLAGVYDSVAKDLFMEQLVRGLQLPDESLGRWRTLLRLSKAGVPWADHLLLQNWPHNTDHELQIIEQLDGAPTNKLVVQRIRELAWRVGPEVIRRHVAPARHPFDWRLIFEGMPVLSVSSSIRARRCEFTLLKGAGTSVAIQVVSIAGPKQRITAAMFGELSERAKNGGPWLPILAGIEFSRAPSRDSLATALRRIAASDALPHAQALLRDLPWVMADCIRFVSSREELVALADRVAKGELGDSDEWLQAERRLRTHGITEADLIESDSDALPFGSGIGVRGSPKLQTYIVHLGSNRESTQARSLLELSTRLRSVSARRFVLSVALRILDLPTQTQVVLNDRIRSALCLALQVFDRFPRDPSVVGAFEERAWEDSEFLQFADQLGRSSYPSSIYYFRSNVRENLLETISAAARRNPARLGLISLIVPFAPHGRSRTSMPARLREALAGIDLTFAAKDPPAVRQSKAWLRLLSDSWAEEEIESLISALLLEGSGRQLDLTLLHSIQSQGEGSRKVEAFLSALCASLPPSELNVRSSVLDLAVRAFDSRRSELKTKARWIEMGLPETLYPLVTLTAE